MSAESQDKRDAMDQAYQACRPISVRPTAEAALADLDGVQAEHAAWPRLSDDQRRAINELWDEMVVPALAHSQEAEGRVSDARLEAQDARAQARYWREQYDRLRWSMRTDA